MQAVWRTDEFRCSKSARTIVWRVNLTAHKYTMVAVTIQKYTISDDSIGA